MSKTMIDILHVPTCGVAGHVTTVGLEPSGAAWAIAHTQRQRGESQRTKLVLRREHIPADQDDAQSFVRSKLGFFYEWSHLQPPADDAP